YHPFQVTDAPHASALYARRKTKQPRNCRIAENPNERAAPHGAHPKAKINDYYSRSRLDRWRAAQQKATPHVRFGSFTTFAPSRRVRFAPRADIRPMPAVMSTRPRIRGQMVS